MILRYILWAISAYILYKFIFDFIVPLVRTSRQIKRQVNEFQSRMQQQQQQESVQQQSNFTKKETSTSKADDYIDFEEVKN